MRKTIVLALVLFLACAAGALWAEEVLNSMAPEAFGLYFNFDVDPMFAFGVGIAKSFRLDFIDRDVLFTADASAPMFLMDLKHWELNAAGRVRLFDIGFLSVMNRLGLFMMTTDNDLYSGITSGFKETILIGHMGERFHVLLEAEYDKDLFTYIANSDLYKAIYPDAKDGWYASTSGRFKFGIQGGISLFGGLSINLRGGYTLTEGFNPVTVPFYFNFCTAYQF
jgi:hypothetical protein